ncbi:MAG TPA: ATP-binding protein, partial [Holophaga sp.]|nr:ATP-binding protein [Holophaga sp.]
LALIDDVLDLSKIEAGRMAVVLEDCSLSVLLAEVVSTVRPLAERNRNQLVLDVEPGIDRFRSDARKLRQIVYNLLSNAAKFTKDGRISLMLRRDPGAPAGILLTVSDTGIGMNGDQMRRIFQEFTQAEETISRTYGGTGLGLTLCRKFTDLLGGTIQVESVPGVGTSFVVTLPGLLPGSGVDGQAEASPVLVVEDDAATRIGLQRILEQEGLPVLGVSDGLEALEALQREHPCLILLDLLMPGMDGFQFLDRLKEREAWRRIPVVVVTAAELGEPSGRHFHDPQVHRVLQKGAYSRQELTELVARFANLP